MADVHSTAVRSYNMSRIRSKDTKPEIIVRRFLFSRGLRFRLHVNSLPGRPDLVLKKLKTVIFVHGCFWHGHNRCKFFVIPKTRTDWWMNKIMLNKKNDKKAKRKLVEMGWNVIEIFECELKSKRQIKTLNRLLNVLL